MPNICDNYVKIRASRPTLQLLIEKELDMEELVPAPQGMTRGSEEWWAWIQENWSTKWVSNSSRDGPPVIEDRNDYIESKFISAWFAPFAFYQNFVRAHPDTEIEYQYSCWETGFIGHGLMQLANVDDEPTHCSYNTPDDLNEGIAEHVGKWKVWTGNPHFDYDEATGLYSWDVQQLPEGGGAAAGPSPGPSPYMSEEDDEAVDVPPVPVQVVKPRVVKKRPANHGPVS
jgi:hypothetical protein